MMQLQPVNEKSASNPWRESALIHETTFPGGFLGVLDFSMIMGKNARVNQASLGSNYQYRLHYRNYGKYPTLKAIMQLMEGTDMRVNQCMSASNHQVDLIRNKEGGEVHASGVWLCGSTWTCPICSMRISNHRRKVIQEAIDKSGLFPVMVTLTLQHNQGDKLKDLLKILKEGWRQTKATRKWKHILEDHCIEGYITATEIRGSKKRGWHPHMHVLFLMKKKIDLDTFEKEISRLYREKIGKNGGYASEYHGIKVTSGHENLSSYLGKWGFSNELFDGIHKEGKKEDSLSSWEMAIIGHEGDTWAANMFKEYASATHGLRAITYSKGLKDKLGIEEIEEDLENMEDEEEIPELIVSIPRYAWKKIHQMGIIGEVLCIADMYGKEELISYLKTKGIRITGSDPPINGHACPIISNSKFAA